jgi:SAM-dependent methyltransferase|tara:strand:+ start:1292 stop:2086 length:795 start_codon:yes stop_codon:yes gene_type:complete
MLSWLFELLKLPEIKHMKNIEELNAVESTILHKKIVKKKRFLRELYLEFYGIFKENTNDIPDGFKIELGSGGGFLKEVISDVITSDVLELPDVDKVFFGEKIPYPDKSVSAFFLLGTLHHIKEPNDFLAEVNRCLKPGAKLIMIEPANTLFSRFFYKHIHHEHFDDKKSEWKVDGEGRLADSNIALPWIIFDRDREKFLTKYPHLEIIQVSEHTPFRYWLSGGLSYKEMVPSGSFEFFTNIEKLLSPFHNILGSFMTIVVKKSE